MVRPNPPTADPRLSGGRADISHAEGRNVDGRLHRRHVRGRRRPRLDHDQPAGALQRVPRADRRRAGAGVQAGLGQRRGRRDCLTGAGEKAFCTGGDQKQRMETGDYGPSRERAVRGRVAAPRDPRRAEAGHRGGQRLRHRRRPRAARAVRPHDRRRHRDLRPERPAGRLVRRRLRHRLPGPRRRREAGPRDLVPAAASTPPSRPRTGAWSTRSCRPTSCKAEVRAWADEILAALADRAQGAQAVVQHRHRALRRDRQHGLHDAEDVRRDRGGQEGITAFNEKRQPDFSAVPRRTDMRPISRGTCSPASAS